MFDKPEDFLKLKYEDITKDNLVKWFAYNEHGKRKFDPSTKIKLDDKIITESGSMLVHFNNYDLIKNTETNLGRIVVNLTLFDIDEKRDMQIDILSRENGTYNLLTFVNYINETFNKKALGKADAMVSRLFAEPWIENFVVAEITKIYIDRCTWLGYCTTFFTSPTLDMQTINPSKKIVAYRDKVLKDNKAIIDSNDALAFDAVEKDILKFAKEQLKADGAQGLAFYESGFKGKFDNNYKNTAIFRGVSAKSDDPTELLITFSNLSDGIEKKDIKANADVAVMGSLGRAIDTRMGGYKTKIFNSAFPSMVLDVKYSNCGSPRTIDVTLTKENIDSYRYRFFIERNTLCILEEYPERFTGNMTKASFENVLKVHLGDFNCKIVNRNDYIGKTVKMRSSHYCSSKKICNICAGDMFYRLNITNLGLLANVISGQLMNFSMKSFHDTAINAKEYKLEDYLEEVK